jgi:hypothetical protein
MDPFPGRLVAVDLNGRSVRPNEEILPSKWTLENVSRTVSVRALLDGPVLPTRRQAIIVRFANLLDEGVLLAQRGESAAFRTHLAAVRLKLRPILVELEDALSVPNTGGDGTIGEFTIQASSDPRAIVIMRQQADSQIAVTLRRTAGLAWALLLPWDVAIGPTWWWANALWLGALVFPVSFFTVRSAAKGKVDTGRGVAWWPLPLVLCTLFAGPVTGLSPLAGGELLGVLVGIVAGFTLEKWSAARRPEDVMDRAHAAAVLP